MKLKKYKRIFSNVSFCFKLLYNANKSTFVFMLLINLFNTLLPIALLYMSKGIINSIVTEIGTQSAVNSIIFMIIMYFVLNISVSFFSEYSNKITFVAMQDLLKHINIGIMSKSAAMDISYFDIPKLYDDVNISRNNARQLQNIVFSVVSLIGSTIRLISSLIIAIGINVWFVLLVILALLPNYIFSKRVELLSYNFEKQQAKDQRRMGYYYSLMLRRDAACEMRYYSFISVIKGIYSDLQRTIVLNRNKFDNKNSFYNFLLDAPSTVAELIITIYTAIKISLNIFTVGDYTFITGIYSTLKSAIGTVFSNFAMFEGYDQRISDYKKYFALNDDKDTSTLEIGEIREIEFKNVSFTYPKSDAPTINNLSFKLRDGEKVMLVGENGAGKTTIVKLICGFYPDYEGEILINGVEARKYNIDSLRKHMSSVFQDYVIYSYTVRENVAFGDIENINNDERIVDCLKLSGLESVNAFNNIDVYVNKEFDESGVILSGGQQQRLAIARAYMRNGDAQLVMMDEPNASLDPIAECELLERFKKLYADRMLLFISHRLSNAKLMDNILVLENGTIIEQGNHNELMKLNGQYNKMFSLQAEKYIK